LEQQEEQPEVALTTTPTLEQQEEQPEVALTTAPTLDQEVGQPVSEPASLPDQPKDTSKMRHRVSVRDEIYTKLKEESKRQGKPVVQLATEAISEYLEKIGKNESLTATDETDF
jgi:sulfite reductase (ferredoxin)